MACLPILVCIVILLRKRIEVQACRALALCLFLCVWNVVPQIIGFAGFYDVWPNLTFFPFSLELLIWPLLFLHAHWLLVGMKLKFWYWLVAPGILQLIYYC